MVMTDIIIKVIRIVDRILAVIGCWQILKKCGKSGWSSLLPGLRDYKFSQITEQNRLGIIVLFASLAEYIASASLDYVPKNTGLEFTIIMVAIVCLITVVFLEYQIIIGLTRVFDADKKLALLWIIVPSIPSLMLGFDKKYQPVHLNEDDPDEQLAGTAPADLSAAVDDDVRGRGLVIHLKDRIVKSQGKKRYLLKDIYLTIPNGSLVLLLGGSGAGKTTLVNAVIGYVKANAVMRLNGEDIYKNYDRMKYRIGFVPQQDILRMNDTVVATLNDAAKLRLPKQMKKEERDKRVETVIETLGMKGRQDGLVARKSGGQKKRISIGMELISDPDLFILDEPDSGLDGVIARELFEKLRAIADTGKIVITITHTPDRVADLFDKVIVLARDSGKVGRLAFYGSPDEAREFFGKDTMENIVMAINGKEAGGEGRADEFIQKYADLTVERGKTYHA